MFLYSLEVIAPPLENDSNWCSFRILSLRLSDNGDVEYHVENTEENESNPFQTWILARNVMWTLP